MISDVVTYLQTAVPALKLVGAAAQFQAAVESNPKATPAAFVISLGDDPGPSVMADQVIQRVATPLGIVLVVRNLSDTKGVAAGQDMEALRAAVKAALLGWQPAAEYDPLQRGRGTLLAFKDGHMWWQDIYLTATYDRSVL